MKTKFPSIFAVALLLDAALAVPFSASALINPAGGLTATLSGNDLILSFPTTSTNYYTVQTSPDLLQSWTNCRSGIPGDGIVETITITSIISPGQGFYRLVIQPKPLGLLLPQSSAFTILGHSCGGIDEQVSASGFDPASGYPTGNVSLDTRCGGSGKGGGGGTTTYTASATVIWDFAGNVISWTSPATGPAGGPTFSATDAYGDTLYNAGANAYLIVPVPAAPTSVTAVQSGDQFQVSWTLQGANPNAVFSSILTATPVSSTAAILTTLVAGPATSGVVVTWPAAVPGDSPIDEYQIKIVGSDGAGTFTQTVSGTTLTASFPVDFVPNWTVTVQAHNAVGWGPISTSVKLGGL